jgi:hypothetical protein
MRRRVAVAIVIAIATRRIANPSIVNHRDAASS